MRRLAALVILILGLPLQAAQLAEIKDVRVWVAPDQTRLVLDTSGEVAHKIFALSNPDRLVIDIDRVRLQTGMPRVGGNSTVLQGLRTASRGGDDLRVVLDLKQSVRAKSFMMKPNDRYGPRLVIEIEPRGEELGAGPLGPTGSSSPGSTAEAAALITGKVPKAKSKPATPKRPKEVVVAIDAGHGGEDPGAIGTSGTREKEVVLAVARELATLVRKEPGMRPVLIRDGDYFVSLRKRMDKARKQQADLFVSVHADAFQDDRVRGSSVYTLSQRGASSEAARWLAEQENRADLIGGVDLDDKDNLLASVLLDLSQSATLEASVRAADKVLSHLHKVGDVHKSSVQQAGFVVLKSPDVPSMLVEVAYISNPAEEARLSNPRQQKQLAVALMNGIRDYFKSYPVPGTRTAQVGGDESRKHVIGRGDTLSGIADQYAVGLSQLRSANNLSDDHIRIGQVLNIPES